MALSGSQCNFTQDFSLKLLAKHPTCLLHFDETYFQVFFSQKRCKYLASYVIAIYMYSPKMMLDFSPMVQVDTLRPPLLIYT